MIPLFKVNMSPEAPAAVEEVLRSGYIGEGSKAAELEARLSTLFAHEAVLTNSCTSAIDLALHMIGVGPGDEVVTTPITCTATNSPIVTRGARPVWADVDPSTGLIDPVDARKKCGYRTKAIMAVDWGGAPCDWSALKRIGPPVIEDAAHAPLTPHGGDYVCYSFGPIKHFTCGDGGALLCPSPSRARLLRWYGLDRSSVASFRCAQDISEAGYKYHMNDINAAIGLANSRLLPWAVERHRANAAWYNENVRNVLKPCPSVESSWWLYTIRVGDRAQFIRNMAEEGIEVGQVHRRNDVHLAFDFPSGPLPGVDSFDKSNCAIPVGWWLSEEDREKIARAVEVCA